MLGHPAVMVLDDTALLAREDPKVLNLLQDFAKRRADDGTFVVRGTLRVFALLRLCRPWCCVLCLRDVLFTHTGL